MRNVHCVSPPHRPFPWASLDATTRRDHAAFRAVRACANNLARIGALHRALEELLGAKAELLVQGAHAAVRTGPFVDGVGFVIGLADAASESRLLVEVEGTLAAASLARCTRRTTPLANAVARSPEEWAGGVAAIVVACARRSHRRDALRVFAAGSADAIERDFVRDRADPLAVTLTVLLDDEAFAARLLVARTALPPEPPLSWSGDALRGLGPIPLGLPVVACAATADVADVASLRVNDVFMPGDWPLRREGSWWLGPVLLSAPDSEVGVPATLGEQGVLVLGAGLSSLRTEADVAESSEAEAVVTAVGDVPVLVRVEIGEARMAAREWASLGRGDVIALGRRVGERVVLRVGGVPVARGDLVDIEGEVGVRITERIAEERTAR